jgi:hypothetical protein
MVTSRYGEQQKDMKTRVQYAHYNGFNNHSDHDNDEQYTHHDVLFQGICPDDQGTCKDFGSNEIREYV